MARAFLLVDADRNFREALAIALRLDGHRVLAADSAATGLARLADAEVGCCLVDAHLAGADEVLAACARNGIRHVVTGPYADLLAHALRRHPAAELLAKPFRAAELIQATG